MARASRIATGLMLLAACNAQGGAGDADKWAQTAEPDCLNSAAGDYARTSAAPALVDGASARAEALVVIGPCGAVEPW